MNTEEDALVSVDDLAPTTATRRKSKQNVTRTRKSSASATTSVKEPSSRSSPISPRSRSFDLVSPRSAGVQPRTSGSASYHPSGYTRRQSSSVSQGSTSQASVLAAYASPVEGSFSSAPPLMPVPNTEKVTEIINNPTRWGTGESRIPKADQDVRRDFRTDRTTFRIP